jgi:hypothetical protein
MKHETAYHPLVIRPFSNDLQAPIERVKIGVVAGGGDIRARLRGKATPNNDRSDRVSGDPSVIARSPCDEAIQGPQHARRQQPRRSYRGPWIASLRSQ